MQPDYQFLIESLNLKYPLIGVYDADKLACFEPALKPNAGKHACLFAFFKSWTEGKTLRLDSQLYGCSGCGTWWFNQETRTRSEYIDFLANDEGLKASEEIMGEWFDTMQRHVPDYRYIYTGPINSKAYDYLKTITFFVNPDQLSVLVAGAQYYNRPSGPTPILAEFGSGCMEMLTLVSHYKEPKAMIGTTDMAMRKYIPKDLIGFSVNKPMFEMLCGLDKSSFLGKPFLRELKKARRGKL